MMAQQGNPSGSPAIGSDGPSTSSKPAAIPGPTSPQSSLIASGQSYVLFPTFTLESGVILHNVPLAYKTWGTLDPVKKNNALVVCHALTGSADVEDWWGPLLGPGKLFDPTRFFIVCTNVLGSPYGSAGPCTRKEDDACAAHQRVGWNGEGWWGPEFPATTVRDDVRITKQLLDYLGVEQVAAVVGGSMGGMAVLEWPILFPVRYPSETPSRADAAPPNDSEARPPYIRAVVPIATAARHSAWGISWAEAQRQSIYSDPAFDHGYYLPSDPPRAGLAAARMAALLTYRSRDSFESRFGRRIGGASRGRAAAQHILGGSASADRRASVAEEAALMHNEGNLSPRIKAETSNSPLSALPAAALGNGQAAKPRGTNGTSATNPPQQKPFSAQSYLRYQGDKFVKRFDANCYVHLTRKMDSHDVARGRAYWALPESNGREPETANPIEVGDLAALRRSQQTNGGDIGAVATGAGGVEDEEVAVGEKRLPRDGEEDDEALERVLGLLTRGTYRQYAPAPPFLVVSVESDGLFAPPEQELLHRFIGGSSIVTIQSPDGHDGFLLEFEQINRHVEAFLRPVLSDIYDREHGVGYSEWKDWGKDEGSSSNTAAGDGLGTGGTRVVKESMSGEVEDLTRW